jgi:hypothetical protein
MTNFGIFAQIPFILFCACHHVLTIAFTCAAERGTILEQQREL